MNFDNRTVTYAGANLLAYSDSIKKATVVDSIIISSNSPAQSADYATLSFNDFGNYKEFPIVNIRHQDNVFQPEAVITNDGMTNPFPLIMIGLKAHTDGESNSAIIAVAIGDSDEPFTIPSQTSVPYKLYLDQPVGYSNSANVKMNVNNAGMVTSEDVNQAISVAVAMLETQTSHNADVSSLSAEIGSVSSAIANNSGIASEFSSVSSGVANNSSAITLLQSSVSTNSSTIGSLQTSVNSNSSNISTLQSSVSNNANSITTLTSSVSANTAYKETITSHNSDIASLASSISTVSSAASSYTYTATQSNAFRAFVDEQSLVAVQNQVNGVLARQSNLIQTLLNNSIYREKQFIPLSYNMSNNVITFGNYNLNGNYMDVGTLFSYCKGLGYNNVSFALINGSSYGITSLDTSELTDETLLFNFTGSAFQQTNVPINGLQMQVTFS